MTAAELKAILQREGRSGIALDIDETLTPTNLHWFGVLRRKFGNPDGLTDKDILERYRYAQNVPHWQSEEALAFMQQMRESNEMVQELPLLDNAHAVVQRVHQRIPVVAYITARPQSVSEGTRQWLIQHNFPEAPIILKDNAIPNEKAASWKAETLMSLYPEVQGIIDDHPRLVHELPKDYPGFVLMYDHKECPETNIRVACCVGWNDVYETLLQLLD